MSKRSKIIFAKEIKLIFQILSYSFIIAFAITSIYAKFEIYNLENSREETTNRQTKNFSLRMLELPNQDQLPICINHQPHWDLDLETLFGIHTTARYVFDNSGCNDIGHYHPEIFSGFQTYYDGKRDFMKLENHLALKLKNYEAEQVVSRLDLGGAYYRKKMSSDISSELKRALSTTSTDYNKRIQDVKNEYEFSFEAGDIGSSLFWSIFFIGFAIIIIRYIIIIWNWVEITSEENIEDD